MFQEVELKYQRLCQTQGEQEAAASEDSSNNQGVFQSAAKKLTETTHSLAVAGFQMGFSDEELPVDRMNLGTRMRHWRRSVISG